MNYIDVDNLKYHVAEGHITARRHPTLPYTVYNYAAMTQFKKIWDNETLKSRGLVLDDDFNVVAVGFRKFFNWEEYPEGTIPIHLPYEVTMKMDGSLLIIRNMGDHVVATTRGSMESPQSAMGKHILEKMYGFDCLDPNYTYLFEVIYKENRIVCLYPEDDVILLSMFDMRTFTEVPYDELPKNFNIVKRYTNVDIEELRLLDIPNEEGFVIRYSNGFRAKIKMKTYMELHRLVSSFTNLSIYECLMNGTNFDQLIETTPDEFYTFAKAVKKELEDNFNLILEKVQRIHDEVVTMGSQKEKALYLLGNDEYKPYAPIVFSMLNGKPYEKAIWKMIEPKEKLYPVYSQSMQS
jgi:RNA ligase